MSEQKSSARFTLFCILLLLVWYMLDTPMDLNMDWDLEDFDIFSSTGMSLPGIAVAIIAVVFAMIMVGLVIAGVSFLLVGIAVLIGGLFLMVFSPFLLPLVLVLIVVSIFKRKSR
ncbi:hypothetical protein H8L32_11155 [Undibacterium sp. CY18W]|uniref:Uncharacterized protein n=1 Tax=Undibacterium hunanense TaxID=2762292 RepID=A0ABR6ZQ79_9BURK|nr:hypothetical protein [Undibacterium hunanense]MBC3918035.1 hypothetical protein [Undibacterium hunanense]